MLYSSGDHECDLITDVCILRCNGGESLDDGALGSVQVFDHAGIVLSNF